MTTEYMWLPTILAASLRKFWPRAVWNKNRQVGRQGARPLIPASPVAGTVPLGPFGGPCGTGLGRRAPDLPSTSWRPEGPPRAAGINGRWCLVDRWRVVRCRSARTCRSVRRGVHFPGCDQEELRRGRCRAGLCPIIAGIYWW